MNSLDHTAPSVGSLTKKVIGINPDLSAQEIIAIVRQAMKSQGGLAGEFSPAEVVNEDQVIKLARATLQSSQQEDL